MITTFSAADFHSICDGLGRMDDDLQMVLDKFGYPPMWTRPSSFETLVHIVLEQQVSLASALAALNKLKERTGELTPASLLTLDDTEMRACYVSRQKMVYIRNMAEALLSNRLDLAALEHLPDAEVRTRLVVLKGVGNWTADIYLMFVLQRADIFPLGDLAAVNALKRVKHLDKATQHESLIKIIEKWKPYRTVATMILWHFYLSERKPKSKITA